MDVEVCQDPVGKPPRLRYDRDTIVAIRKNAQLVDLKVDENLLKVSALSQKTGRGKSKSATGKTLGADRSRETGGIVLGPQKRAWNTGCHVSYTNRDNPEATSARGGKAYEFRCKDRLPSRGPEIRNEYRERTGVRRNEMGQFSRTRAGEDRQTHRKAHDEEPEWFSEGPTNVTETIELGRVLEDDELETPVQNDDIKPFIPIEDVTKEDSLLIASESNPSQPIVSFAETPSPTNLHDNNGESHGSRFRYLFPKQDVPVEKKKTANDHLLELLKGSPGSSTSLSQEQNVLQVENKLRSLLLGHSLAKATHPSQPVSFVKESVPVPTGSLSKPKILTVEEIEAQLKLPSYKQDLVGCAQARSCNTEAHESSSTPNLAPVLNSLALKQRGCCSNPSRNQVTPFDATSNPMSRFPSATNAMSASARITQLQHSEPPVTHGISEINQGNAYAWDNRFTLESNNSRSIHPSIVTKSVAPICMGAPPGLGDVGSRSGNSCNPALGPSMPVPRRPIVKAQQMVSPLSQLTNSNPGSPDLITYNRGLDRRFFNLPMKTQFQSNGGEALYPGGDKPQLNSVYPTADNEFCLSTSYASSLNQPLNHLMASNNSNMDSFDCSSKVTSVKPQTENTLAFLSQLVEMDRSNQKPTSSFNHLLKPSAHTKTLEEIEN